MKEIQLNSIDNRYTKLTNVLKNDMKLDELKFDLYYSFPIDVYSIDYGFIKLANGSFKQVYVATSKPEDYRQLTVFISEDGITWYDISCDNIASTMYNKVIIYCGNVYICYDDTVVCLYDFELNENQSSMSVTPIKDDAQDITVANNVMYMLAHDGVYTVDAENNVEFISLTADFPFERFIPSTTGELAILGYAGNYPMFLLYDGQSHLVFCTTPCTVTTAIVSKDQIFCYTRDAKVISVYKTFEMDKASYMVFSGHEWCGEVTYFHSHFWLSYVEHENEETYTLVAKSPNGVDFTPDTKIPHTTEHDGIATWNYANTYCVCAGQLFTLIASINYFKYGESVINKYTKVDINDDYTVSIPIEDKIDNINKCHMNVYICDEEGYITNKDVRFDIIPHIVGDNIEFKLRANDYSDRYVYLVLDYTASV